MGCDDTAKSEFLNKRAAKGHIAGPQSQSNLWFVKPEQLDTFGPVIGRGAVWENESVNADTVSDPYLFSGYDHRGLHLSHDSTEAVTFTLEVDKAGNNTWTELKKITVPAKSYTFTAFTADEKGTWVRIKSDKPIKTATAAFTYRNTDSRSEKADSIFDGLATGSDFTGGIVRARDGNKRSLSFAAIDKAGNDIGYYEMDDKLQL